MSARYSCDDSQVSPILPCPGRLLGLGLGLSLALVLGLGLALVWSGRYLAT